MGRNTQISIEDKNNQQLAIYKIPYGAKLFCENGEEIKKGKKICEWDPYTLPVIAEKNGLRVLEKNIMHRQMSGAKNSIMVALKK